MSLNLNKKIPLREQTDPKYRWRIEDLFESDEAWEKEYADIEKEIPALTKFAGGLGGSGKYMLACFKAFDEAGERFERLYCYASMRFHEDSGSEKYQALSNRADALMIKLMAAGAFIEPEVLEIPGKKLEEFIQKTEGLSIYRHYVENIIRKRPHTLSRDVEELLSRAQELADAPQDIFTMLNDADMSFADIKDGDGEMYELTKGKYTSFLESGDRTLRKNAFKSLYSSYINQKNTIAAAYSANVKADVFYARARNYGSSVEMALADDNIPVSVYDNLVKTVHKNIGLMHRYVELRRRMLGLDELHMYDLYTPLVPDVDFKISYEQAKEIVVKALAPMGEEYSAGLKEGLEGGWIDVYENKGKRGGAYSWGAYPGHPFVLLNHNDNINSLFTLAHEMGHAMHSYYTWKTMPYIYSGHKIFVAEVASTCNEALLTDYLIKSTDDKNRLKFIINYNLEQFRGTLFRQTMFAEFERLCHDEVERGGALTADSMSRLYMDLNRFYFGDNIVIDDEIGMEWARIPHFYNSFYVYQYATGYSAALALSDAILTKGEPAVDKYLGFLKKGSSEYSVELLRGAGVDMSSGEPVKNAMKIFEGLLDKLEGLC